MPKYKKYEKYKDSGEEWIGKIPESFKIEKLKYLTKFYGSRKTDITPYLLSVIMSSEFIKNEIATVQNESSMEKLNYLQIKNLSIILPEKQEEQMQIEKFLKQKTFDIDRLVVDKKKLIILLKEIRNITTTQVATISNLVENIELQIKKLRDYRNSLILEVVTGKIDVRNY